MTKNWAMLTVLAVLGLVLIPLHSFAAVDSETAVGVWLFDDGEVSDSSGNGNDGELMNGAEVTDVVSGVKPLVSTVTMTTSM